tara:strand:- start:163 stop:579 length:417 start_codon:yes stop_codon:yes gene_type:complete
MIDKFGNVFYLIIYLAHFIIVGSYAYQLVFDTKKFLKGRGVDKTATLLTRFAGSFMVAVVLMSIYVAFVRPGGLEATWAFFNLVFIINVSILVINYYSLKIDKTGLTKKTKEDGIYAPLVLVIMSAVLCYGLADKIYV